MLFAHVDVSEVKFDLVGFFLVFVVGGGVFLLRYYMAMGTAQSRELNLKPFHFKELFSLKQSQNLKLKDLRKCSVFLYYPLDSRIISRSKYAIFMLHLGKLRKTEFHKNGP